MNVPTLIVLIGPTAVGKTKMAIELAKEFNAEIISADSRQFFKEISIGTAKPSEKELSEVQHHFINHLSITEEYNASKFEVEVLDFLKNYFKRKEIAILCGGSGLYVNALLYGFDDQIPTADHKLRIELNNLFESKGLKALQDKLRGIDPQGFAVVDQNNAKRLLRAIEINLLTGKSILELRKGVKKNDPSKQL